MGNTEGWKSKEVAEKYLRVANVVIPGRKEILSIIAELATLPAQEMTTILDLGCGYGDVTDEIIHLKPLASVCMIDFNEEMLRLCGERFKFNGNIRNIQYDLNMGIPTSIITENFDAVVSCFAIHHIELINRVKLYSDIRKILREGGLFINGDRFRGDSAIIDRWEFDNWIGWIVKQIKENLRQDKSFSEIKQKQLESDKKLGDKPGTIWDMEQDLRKAGFRNVDCVWKFHNLAVIAATK